MCADFVSHPLFIARVAHAHFLIGVARHIPVVATARCAYNLPALPAVVFTFEDVKLAAAYLTCLTKFIWLPGALWFYFSISRATHCPYLGLGWKVPAVSLVCSSEGRGFWTWSHRSRWCMWLPTAITIHNCGIYAKISLQVIHLLLLLLVIKGIAIVVILVIIICREYVVLLCPKIDSWAQSNIRFWPAHKVHSTCLLKWPRVLPILFIHIPALSTHVRARSYQSLLLVLR